MQDPQPLENGYVGSPRLGSPSVLLASRSTGFWELRLAGKLTLRAPQLPPKDPFPPPTLEVSALLGVLDGESKGKGKRGEGVKGFDSLPLMALLGHGSSWVALITGLQHLGQSQTHC